LGDPDFHSVPLGELLDPRTLMRYAAAIDMKKATPSASLAPRAMVPSGTHTTHLSVLDAQGNYVAATLSINLPFGSGFTVPGTGVLLNNEMDDFAAQPGSPNAYGLVGSEANAIAPGKRPLSSMTPSFIEFRNAEGSQVGILGTPGGSRIITMVLLGMLTALDGLPPEDWVSRPRFHHQYLPDVVEHEAGALDAKLLQALKAKGHQFREISRPYGNMQAILWNRTTGKVQAASDPRRIGSAEVQ
jgi:gamma-glutamyltranspeptidase/glutathione hydrolase